MRAAPKWEDEKHKESKHICHKWYHNVTIKSELRFNFNLRKSAKCVEGLLSGAPASELLH